jgi:NUMOD4 motif-containing protein/HNH endonuclease
LTSNITDEHETWQPVVGYEGLYEVSDMGRVRSVDRMVWRDGAQYSKPHQVPKPGRIKSSHIQELGYVGVMLWRDGKVSNLRVHRLVLEAFVGPAPEDMETLHGNGVRHDNRLVNLRWGTWAENYADRVRHGTAPDSKGSCKRGHLLAVPNLQPRKLEQGVRACLACSRAMSSWHWMERDKPGHGEDRGPWVQVRSDKNYESIMASF